MESPEVSLIVNAIDNVNANVTDIRGDMRLLRRDVNDKIEELKTQLKEHEKADKEYWAQIDERQTQLALIKGLTFSSFGLWVWTYFSEKLGLK